jgi:cardiolipin synthase
MSWPLVVGGLFYAGGWIICLLMLFQVPRKRDPEAAVGWLIFSFFLPYLGALVFTILGSPKLPQARRTHQREIDAFVAKQVKVSETDPELTPVLVQDLGPRQQPIAALVERLGGLPAFGHNAVELLPDYTGALDRLIADIDAARHYVHLLYYIFADDTQGRRVADAVCRAATRGVRCRVLYDALGNRAYLGALLKRLHAASVETYPMLPLKLVGAQHRRPDLRNHRKLAIIDGVVAYTGSQNLTDPTFKPGIVYEELVARVCGPVVVQLATVFLMDWLSETERPVPEREIPQREALLTVKGGVSCQVLPGGPAYDTDNIPLLFAALLYQAQHRAVLTTPYFIPDASLLRAIENAALRGVEVHLIVSAQGDQFLVSRAQRSYYEELLECGVTIHAVRSPSFIHAKHLSIDNDISVVGSSNFDVRSFRLNLEIVLVSYSSEVVARQREIEAGYMTRADIISLEQWRQRPQVQQFMENTSRLVSALL